MQGVSAESFQGGNMSSILYPRQDTDTYTDFDSYKIADDMGQQTVNCRRGTAWQENNGPKGDAQIIMSSTRLPGYAWMIKDARDDWHQAPDENGQTHTPDGFEKQWVYDHTTKREAVSHRVSIGLGKIIQKSNQRYRTVYKYDMEGVHDWRPYSLQAKSQAFISSLEDYLTGSTSSWWVREVAKDKHLTFVGWGQVEHWDIRFPEVLQKDFPPEPDVRNRPLVWANLNWADVGTISNAASGVDHSGYAWEGDERRYKAAIIQWGKVTPGYQDSRGNRGAYPSYGDRNTWIEDDRYGSGVGWKVRYDIDFEETPPEWYSSRWPYEGHEFWSQRIAEESTHLSYKFRNGDPANLDDYDNPGTVVEYFLCVAGATKGSSSSHELYDDKGVLKGSFEMPIWRKDAWYWGDPNDRDDDGRRKDTDSPGDECLVLGIAYT